MAEEISQEQQDFENKISGQNLAFFEAFADQHTALAAVLRRAKDFIGQHSIAGVEDRYAIMHLCEMAAIMAEEYAVKILWTTQPNELRSP
jgi:hypothetical protein